MLTEKTRKVLHQRTDKILARLSYRDMESHKSKLSKAKQRNYKGGYTLAEDTEEALRIHTLACKPVDLITLEDEEEIKGFIMRNRLLFPELLV